MRALHYYDVDEKEKGAYGRGIEMITS